MKKVLLFIATHGSKQHIQSLCTLWSSAAAQEIASLTDTLILSSKKLPNATLFPFPSVRVVRVPLESKQIGAKMAMIRGIRDGWFSRYDWIIRSNPDVAVKNATFLLTSMRDATVDGLFAGCRSNGPNTVRGDLMLHTDFYAVRPRVLPSIAQLGRFGRSDENPSNIAEQVFTSMMLSDRAVREHHMDLFRFPGPYRWLNERNGKWCRISTDDIVHVHGAGLK